MAKDIINEVEIALKGNGKIELAVGGTAMERARQGDFTQVDNLIGQYRAAASALLGYEPAAQIDLHRGVATIDLNRRKQVKLVKPEGTAKARDFFASPEKHRDFNLAHLNRIMDMMINLYEKNPAAASFDMDVPYSALINKLSPEDVEAVRKKISDLNSKFGSDPKIAADDMNISFKATETRGRVVGAESRKVYISPPFNKLPEFMETLFPILARLGVKYISPKIHQEDLVFNETAQLVAQKQNTVCFYFADDLEFAKFVEAVDEAERTSGIALLQYPNTVSYGQFLDGKINFGVDSVTQSFDKWSASFYDEIYNAYKQARERHAPGNAKTAMLRAAETALKRRRGIGPEKFLDMAKNATTTQEEIAYLLSNPMFTDKYLPAGNTALTYFRSNKPEKIAEFKAKIRSSGNCLVLDWHANFTRNDFFQYIGLFKILVAEQGQDMEWDKIRFDFAEGKIFIPLRSKALML